MRVLIVLNSDVTKCNHTVETLTKIQFVETANNNETSLVQRAIYMILKIKITTPLPLLSKNGKEKLNCFLLFTQNEFAQI